MSLSRLKKNSRWKKIWGALLRGRTKKNQKWFWSLWTVCRQKNKKREEKTEKKNKDIHKSTTIFQIEKKKCFPRQDYEAIRHVGRNNSGVATFSDWRSEDIFVLQDKRPLVFTIKTKKKQKLDFWNQNASGNFSHVGNLRFFSRNAMTGFVSMAASKKKKSPRARKSNQIKISPCG